jgi:hypothetical protein
MIEDGTSLKGQPKAFRYNLLEKFKEHATEAAAGVRSPLLRRQQSSVSSMLQTHRRRNSVSFLHQTGPLKDTDEQHRVFQSLLEECA